MSVLLLAIFTFLLNINAVLSGDDWVIPSNANRAVYRSVSSVWSSDDAVDETPFHPAVVSAFAYARDIDRWVTASLRRTDASERVSATAGNFSDSVYAGVAGLESDDELYPDEWSSSARTDYNPSALSMWREMRQKLKSLQQKCSILEAQITATTTSQTPSTSCPATRTIYIPPPRPRKRTPAYRKVRRFHACVYGTLKGYDMDNFDEQTTKSLNLTSAIYTDLKNKLFCTYTFATSKRCCDAVNTPEELARLEAGKFYLCRRE